MSKRTKSADGAGTGDTGGAPAAEPKAGGAQKTKCPISRAHFAKEAKPLLVQIAGQQFVVNAREFGTGSLGWYANGKVAVEVGGVPVSVQVGINLTVVGSKELEK